MVRGFAVLMVMQFAGELLCWGLSLPLPANVVGMILLLLAFSSGFVEVEWVSEASDLLLSHMALFFVPAGVGVMVYFNLLEKEWLPIVGSTVLSTFAFIAVTGWTAAWLEKRGAASDE